MQPVESFQEALLYCAGIDYCAARQHNQHTLARHGIDVLDVRPSQLSAQLLSQYLSIKKSGQY